MTMAKATPLTTPERLHALVHELNYKDMQRVLDAELDRVERDATPAAELLQRLLEAVTPLRPSAVVVLVLVPRFSTTPASLVDVIDLRQATAEPPTLLNAVAVVQLDGIWHFCGARPPAQRFEALFG
jgi:hypothetical protein